MLIHNNNSTMSNHHPKEPETDTTVKSIDPERTRVRMPLLTQAAIIATVISGTLAASNWMNSITTKIEAIDHHIQAVDKKLDGVIAGMWTQQDQEKFALELKVQNPSLSIPSIQASMKQFAATTKDNP